MSVVSALFLSACQGSPLTMASLGTSPISGPARGIDLPIDASDVLNELKGGRIDFVARYYRKPESRWPTLTAAEAQRLSGLGLKLVTVWESHSHNPAYFSYASGYNDALSAYKQARNVGQPAGSAIYFAVDFDARADHMPEVDRYFRGVAAGMHAASAGAREYKIGVYGSGAVCAAVRRAGLAQYAWLSNSTAWAGYAAYSTWNIRQGGRLASLSFNHDANEARDEFGAFRVGGADAVVTAPTIAANTAVRPVSGASPQPSIAAQQESTSDASSNGKSLLSFL